MRGPVLCFLCIACASSAGAQEGARAVYARVPGTSFRALSWNVAETALSREPATFLAMLRLADPDLIVLDEVSGSHTAADIRAAVRGTRGAADTVWHVALGTAGGVQRGAVASREPLEMVAELEHPIYPDSAVVLLLSLAPDSLHPRIRRSLAAGIPAVGVLALAAGRTLLMVSVDLQSGGAPEGWEEHRRTIEAHELRSALRRALTRVPTDGVLVAGDLNLVATPLPLGILGGPYPPPHLALLPAEARHREGLRVWTWDGRGTPFPSRPLDFQLYSPASLEVLQGIVLDTEDLSTEELVRAGLTADASRRLSDHRPVVVDYRWRQPQ